MSKYTLNAQASAFALGFVVAAVPSLEAVAQTDIGALTVVSRQAKPKKAKAAAKAHARHVPAVARTGGSAGAARGAAQVAAAEPVAAAGASKLPVFASSAVGSKAPPGSAPALAPSQAPLDSIEPTSIVSDKVIRDMVQPSADFNQIIKYTPGAVSTASNGLIGDSNKGGWRGFSDGQYNVTFDGIPFGDENNPSHHSASYFPSGFIGGATIDRGPGPASQAGYATFGGTLALRSLELSDKFGGSIENSYGSYSTFVTTETLQSGLDKTTGVRALVQYSHSDTAGAQQYGLVEQNGWLMKADRDFGLFNVTVFGNYSREHYNNTSNITYPQYYSAGSHYGAVGSDPTTQQYVGNNVSEKQTDMEYINLKWDYSGIRFNDKVYTYSYWYPWYQRNSADQTVEGSALANVQPKAAGLSVPSQHVVGFLQINNYRAWGNLFDAKYDLSAGYASGELRTGVWWERGDNWRRQFYTDYTNGVDFTLKATSVASYQAAYKLDLGSHYQNVQPFIEYEWKPIEGLSITPGYKFIAFTRDQNARLNQTTLTPLYYEHTYRSGLPFLSARYKVLPELSVYGQASRGYLVPTVSAYYVANPDFNNIQPQTTTNFQIGAVYKTEKLAADVALYQITANNFPITTTNPDKTVNYQNGGTARYRGVEMELTYQVMPGLALTANGSISDARFLEGQYAGLYVGAAPRYTAMGGVVYDDGQFFGSLLHKQVGDQWGSAGQRSFASIYVAGLTNPTLNYIPSYASTDFVIGARGEWLKEWGHNNKIEVKFGVNNIADNRSVTGISGEPAGLLSVANTKLTYSFMAGRLFYGGVKVDF
ncbi:TonB-dependent receptor [Methylosinus sporium]|uniref:TonB-dependent receptor n=1 Tax=Methylosinus sporium TaxID=428 RepID=UPI00383ADE78